MAKTKAKQIKIQLVKSLIGASEAQKKVAKALGLSKMNQVVEHSETPVIMGMVNKIPHLVKVVD
ncbi:MAG: 50S ribosomal protein L30 [bacterium]|nr:50S ribosomal protein L30 [bacterium]